MGKIASNFRNIAGQRFGRLVAIEATGKNKWGSYNWLCICDCGKAIEIVSFSLIHNRTKSCGCLNKEKASQRWRTHGMTNTRIHDIWVLMRDRCSNPHNNRYAIYGGRGIKVCDRWLHSFENFHEDMKDGYADNLSIDRIDTNGNYEKPNCKWSTITDQANNTRTNHFITFNDKTLTIAQWGRSLNINGSTLSRRLNLGWSIEEVLTKSKMKNQYG